MKQQMSFTIAAHGNLELAPSGDHVMLLGLKQPLKVNEDVDLTLKFDDGTEQVISIKVTKQDMTKQHGEMEHHHH